VEPGDGQGSTNRYLKALRSSRTKRDTNKQRSKIRRNINGQGSKCSKTKEVINNKGKRPREKTKSIERIIVPIGKIMYLYPKTMV
jgi:hypothetical protein